LKKSAKKLLQVFTLELATSPGQKLTKVFCFFFSKKEVLSYFLISR